MYEFSYGSHVVLKNTTKKTEFCTFVRAASTSKFNTQQPNTQPTTHDTARDVKASEACASY